MKQNPYCGRTGLSKWLYIHEDWWLPLIFILVIVGLGLGVILIPLYLYH